MIRLLDAGGPKEFFPYLDARLSGVYLSGAARVSGEGFRLGLLSAARKSGAKEISGTVLYSALETPWSGVQIGEEIIGTDAVIVTAGAWSSGIVQADCLQTLQLNRSADRFCTSR